MTLREQLEAMLNGTKLHGFEMILQSLLSREGYGEVTLMGRRRSKQKSRYGGFELLCKLSIGPEPFVCIVKVVHQHEIRVRQVMEAAGNVDRMKVDMAIIATPLTTCESTAQVLPLISKSRVDIWDGPRIADLMIKYGIGVRNGEVDYAYFGWLNYIADKSIEVIEDAEKCL